jgi:hypothetical protein
MTIRARVFHTLKWVALVLVLACGATYGYSLVEPPYLYYQNLPFPALQRVHAGEIVTLSVERCNRSDETQTYVTTHNIRSAATRTSFILPTVPISIEPGCWRDTSPANRVPLGTPPGSYDVWGVAIIKGMFGAERQIKWYSESFQVLGEQ